MTTRAPRIASDPALATTGADPGPRATARERRLQALYAGVGLGRVRGEAPRVAVVGAGLAGLTAARLLKQAGCRIGVFEASDRIGGRVWTERALGDAGSVVECGGEFIDTQHADLLALVRHLGLPLLDLDGPSEAALSSTYHFGGQVYGQDAFDAALQSLTPQLRADIARCSPRASRRRHTPDDRHFDHLSIAEYLQGLDAEPWVKRAIEVAYVTVYGLQADEQSSINLLSLIGDGARQGTGIFGRSDERYKLRDGSGQVTDRLAQGLDGQLYPGHRLVRLERAGRAYRLNLARGAGATVAVDADFVVLALPFTLLRQVELGELFSPHKQRVIAQVGYGTNSKLMVGLHRPVWRELGLEGGIYTDMDFQTTWECSRGRAAEPAVFTIYLGGREGVAVGQGAAEAHARRHARLIDQVFPGFSEALTGFVRRVDWTREPFALGSYTCYRPGQWTTMAGDEATPEGRVFFAGEHCATGSQGYMDGAVATGRQAAQAILRRLV